MEWAVFPPSMRVAAMPDDATAIQTLPCDRSFAKARFRTKVLPVPPGASRKTKAGWAAETVARIQCHVKGVGDSDSLERAETMLRAYHC